MTTTLRPQPDEYASSFAAYVALIEDDEDVWTVLSGQIDQIARRFDGAPESRGEQRYEPGKWSIKEVLGHLSDAERVFDYRALRIGLGDDTALPGFDDQSCVTALGAADRTLGDVMGEWIDVRRATLSLFGGFPERARLRRGVASGHPTRVRSLAYTIAGHTRHHVSVLDLRYSAGEAGRVAP